MESWLIQLEHLLILLFFMSFKFQLSIESDSIIPGETLSGIHTLTSQGEVFEMGFFAPPGNSHDYYIGIWYKGLPMPQKTVVWVANRDSPVSDPYSSWLELSQDGHLVLLTSSGLTVWSTNSNSSAPPSNSTVGTLGDDGNFIIRERSKPFLAKEERKIWQSFDYPTDTWLPGAKFGYDKDTGIKTILNSWKDTSNPSMGFN
ncbi:S-locus-specific glycoprotein S13-like [Gastrolobium bilobum]|uniref:S-locus-specific glycoprotein S13-like n=1 Tax=Gastrolobium bilobum TaxID=150636 RepID=UPI002AB1ADB9|nr:S-locus-specific glycoprotein S13-like [Gastrolobium bilobum]